MDDTYKDDCALIDRAMMLREQGDIHGAIALYTTLIRNHPVAELYNERGLSHAACNDFGNAISDFTKALELSAADAVYYLNRGNMYIHTLQYELALDDLSTALRLSPMCKEAYNSRGYVFGQVDELNRAFDDFLTAIQIDQRCPSSYFNMGAMLLRSDRVEESLHYLDLANQLNANDVPTLCIRGDAKRSLGRFEEAVEDYRHAVALGPDYTPACRRLTWILATCPLDAIRDGTAAVALGIRACEQSKWEDGDCVEALAAAYAECGDFPNAIAMQTTAVALFEGDDKVLAAARLHSYSGNIPTRDTVSHN